MTTTPGEPYPREIQPSEPLAPPLAEPVAEPAATPPIRPRLPQRQKLDLDAGAEVSMVDLAIEHGRTGTTNEGRVVPSDTYIIDWLRSLGDTQLMAFTLGDVPPDDVLEQIAASDAHHAAEGNHELRPSSWMLARARSILEERMNARRLAPRPANKVSPRHPKHAAASDAEIVFGPKHDLRDAEHNVLDSLEVVRREEGGGTVWRARRPPDEITEEEL